MRLNLALRQVFTYYRSAVIWSIPLRLLFSAIFGVIGSAGLLGWLSEYATYSYSVYYGFRPAIEGVPYLKAAVALASVFILVSAAFIYILFYYYNKIIVATAASSVRIVFSLFNFPVKNPNLLDNRPRSGWHLLLRVLLVSALSWISLIAGFAAGAGGGEAIDKLFSSYTLVATLSVFIFLTNLAVARKLWLGRIALFVAICNILFWISLMFVPSTYAHFLRVVGHGGGFPVELEIADNRNLQAHLLLRTSDSYLLFLDDKKSILEIPRSRVKSVIQKTDALYSDNHLLPVGGRPQLKARD